MSPPSDSTMRPADALVLAIPHSTAVPKPRKFQCPTCQKRFTTSGHLSRHARIHTGERNFACPYPGCNTRCSRKDNLTQHYRVHLGPGSRTRARRSSRAASTGCQSGSSEGDSPSSANSGEAVPSKPKFSNGEEYALYLSGPDRFVRPPTHAHSRDPLHSKIPSLSQHHLDRRDSISSSPPTTPQAPVTIEPTSSSPFILKSNATTSGSISPSPHLSLSRSNSIIGLSANSFRNHEPIGYDARADLHSSHQQPPVEPSPPSLSLPSLTPVEMSSSSSTSSSSSSIDGYQDECISPSSSSCYSDSSALLTPDVRGPGDSGYFFADHQVHGHNPHQAHPNQYPLYQCGPSATGGGVIGDGISNEISHRHLLASSHDFSVHHQSPSASPYPTASMGSYISPPPLSYDYPMDGSHHHRHSLPSTSALLPTPLHHPRPMPWGFDGGYSPPPTSQQHHH